MKEAIACTFRPRYHFLLCQAGETHEAIKIAQDAMADIDHLDLKRWPRRAKVLADLNDLLTRAEDKIAQVEGSLLGFANGLQIAAPANIGKEIADTDQKRTHHGITPLKNKVAKTKRGPPGFINGSRTAALADTGAAQNIISADFAQKNGLVLEGKTAMFRLGNSKTVRSAGKSKQAVEVLAVTFYTC